MGTARLVRWTRPELMAQKRVVLLTVGMSESQLQAAATGPHSCGHEVDAWREVEQLNWLLGY